MQFKKYYFTILLFTAANLYAASFDCNKAKTYVEKTICDVPSIGKLDEELAVKYKSALGKFGEVVKLEQRAWLKDLNTCSDAKCVHTAYVGRISDLDILMKKDGNAQVKTGFSDQDKKLIQHYGACSSIRKAMVAMLNRDGDSNSAGQAAHYATIYSILTLKVAEKYPESMNQEAINIANQFLKSDILNKSLTGQQLSSFAKKNGGCYFDEVPDAEISQIMNAELPRYEKLFQKIKNIK